MKRNSVGDGCSPELQIEGTACSDFPAAGGAPRRNFADAPPVTKGNERSVSRPSAVPLNLTRHPVIIADLAKDPSDHDHQSPTIEQQAATRNN